MNKMLNGLQGIMDKDLSLFSGISAKKVDADGNLKDPGYLLFKKLIANIRKC